MKVETLKYPELVKHEARTPNATPKPRLQQIRRNLGDEPGLGVASLALLLGKGLWPEVLGVSDLGLQTFWDETIGLGRNSGDSG